VPNWIFDLSLKSGTEVLAKEFAGMRELKPSRVRDRSQQLIELMLPVKIHR
jgi:hypothetical protein